MITCKLSHSILSAWANHQYEQAIGLYLGKPLPATAAMELGSLKDQQWSIYVDTHKRMPDELGGEPLDNPITQQKYQKLLPFSDNIQILLRGVPDIVSGTTIIDTKCGMTTANGYIDRMQLSYYKLLLPKATLGVYVCFNPYLNTYSKGIKFLDETDAEAAYEHIVTYGGELIDYLQANRLLKDYAL